MRNEDFERQMAFILEQQAKFAENLGKQQERKLSTLRSKKSGKLSTLRSKKSEMPKYTRVWTGSIAR